MSNYEDRYSTNYYQSGSITLSAELQQMIASVTTSVIATVMPQIEQSVKNMLDDFRQALLQQPCQMEDGATAEEMERRRSVVIFGTKESDNPKVYDRMIDDRHMVLAIFWLFRYTMVLNLRNYYKEG